MFGDAYDFKVMFDGTIVPNYDLCHAGVELDLLRFKRKFLCNHIDDLCCPFLDRPLRWRLCHPLATSYGKDDSGNHEDEQLTWTHRILLVVCYGICDPAIGSRSILCISFSIPRIGSLSSYRPIRIIMPCIVPIAEFIVSMCVCRSLMYSYIGRSCPVSRSGLILSSC